MSATAFEERLGRRLMSREEFAATVGGALDEGKPFATAKLGQSERHWLLLGSVLEHEPDPLRRRAYESAMAARSFRHAGLFPADAKFVREWAARYADEVGELDVLGVFFEQPELHQRLLDHHGLGLPLVHYRDQEPARRPHDLRADWLAHLAGRRLLLVSPFAELMAERANTATFDAVWERVGTRWPQVASVAALPVPYGWDAAVRERHGTSLTLLDHMCERLAEHEFDLALIGAGHLGTGLAVAAKARGRAGFSLGGHMQPLFGLLGERWRGHPEFEPLVTRAWIDTPSELAPDGGDSGEDYW